MPTKIAAFWIASANYVAEADNSRRSFSQHIQHSHVETFIFTASPTMVPKNSFSNIVVTPKNREEFWFYYSTKVMADALQLLYASGFEAALYLDTDTYVCEPLTDLFEMAEQFDLCGAFAPGRQTRKPVTPIPAAFPEMNVGVNLFALNHQTINTVENWRDQYQLNLTFYGNNDQAALREILWFNTCKINVAILPTEFNFRFGFGGWMRGVCRVLHGRSDSDYESIARKVNAKIVFRSFEPGEL